jgi:predicted  nucleic acid-binding Zn-ribbon protein
MATLDAALARFAAALDAVEARAASAIEHAKASGANAAATEALTVERDALAAEVERLEGEMRALDDLHEDISAKLEAAIRDVQGALNG